MTPRERYRRKRKYRETKRRYDRSAKAKAARARYEKTPKGRATKRRYERSSKGRLATMIHKSPRGDLIRLAHDAASWATTRAELVAAAKLWCVASDAQRFGTRSHLHCLKMARQLLYEANEIWPLPLPE